MTEEELRALLRIMGYAPLIYDTFPEVSAVSNQNTWHGSIWGLDDVDPQQINRRKGWVFSCSTRASKEAVIEEMATKFLKADIL